MIIKSTLELGGAKYEFTVDERSDIEALHKSIVLANPPKWCNVCKETGKVKFATNKDTEGNTYVNIKCQCGASAKLGLYKTGGYFWHKFEQYIPKAKSDMPEGL